MANAKQVNEVNEVKELSLIQQFDLIIAEQIADITRSADMLVSVEKLEGDVADTKAGISSLVYGVLISQGEPMTLAWFDMVRLQWGGVYRSAKGGALSDSAVDTAWSRVFKLVGDDYGLTKPKAETKDAEKKAEQRAKHEELIASYVDTPIADIKAEIKQLFNKAGDGDKEAKKQADKLVKVVDVLQKDEVKAEKDTVKELKDQIRLLLKEVNNVEVLHEVFGILQGHVDDVYVESMI
jgi:hypothetical protein